LGRWRAIITNPPDPQQKGNMIKKDKDPFGFHKAINWDKLNDPKVLKELEELFGDNDDEGNTAIITEERMKEKT